MTPVKYGASPAHVHVRQLPVEIVKEPLPLAIKELVPEKIKISWEIDNGK